MAKVTKRRVVKKNRPHQHLKGEGGSSGPNWARIAVIAIGIIIALSMLLSLVVVPGSGF